MQIRSLVVMTSAVYFLHAAVMAIHSDPQPAAMELFKMQGPANAMTDTLSILSGKPEGIFRIEKVLEKNAHFFTQGDIIQISNVKGMIHYKKGKKVQA